MHTDDSASGGIGEECPTYESLMNDTSKVELKLNGILNRAIILIEFLHNRLRFINKLAGSFEWSQTDQSLVLGSFFYGYVTSQLFGGFMIERFGAKRVFGVGTFIESLLALCSPTIAKTGIGPYIALRIFQGLSEVN